MSGIYVSTGAFHGGRLAEMAEACESLGAGLELSSGVRWHPGLEAEIDEVAVARKGKLLVHNYFPPPEKPFVLNLASTNPFTLELSKAHARAAIDLTARLGAPFYSVHSGFAMDLKAEDLGRPDAQLRAKKVPNALAYTTFLAAVRELSGYAKARGVRLLIENNVIAKNQVRRNPLKMQKVEELWPWLRSLIRKGVITRANLYEESPLPAAAEEVPEWVRAFAEKYGINIEIDNTESPLLMTEPGELGKIFRYLNDTNIGLLLDVGHAKVSAAALGFEPGKFFEELAPWIGALHLSDNDGIRDNNKPFGPDAWFAKYFLGDVPLVIEAYRIEIDGVAKLVDIVKRWVGEKRG
jgi:sugar phosphate isomerase/epimerase